MRYKVLYGGRGGIKSWSIARALLSLGGEKPLRILCAREFQNSLTDSVLALLADQIRLMNLSYFYTVQKAKIIGANGTEFSFEGLRNNVASLKSYEGADICWVEEAATVSAASWEVLIPTIRKKGSEIWISFNPELEEDETYKRFVLDPPTNSIVVKTSYLDNKWLTDELDQEIKDLEAKNPDEFLHVYGGHCKQMLDGAVYANELRAATGAGRITRVPYDPTKPVHTFWDLGWSDSTSVWFAQAVGFDYRILEYYENSQKTINHFLEYFQTRGYVYGTDYLPHDAASRSLASGGRSIEQIMRDAGRKVVVLPKSPVATGINAARTLFTNCWFDAEKCKDGLTCLRRYRYERDPDSKVLSRTPKHDGFSHGADAFRQLAMSIKDAGPKKKISLTQTKVMQVPDRHKANWLGR